MKKSTLLILFIVLALSSCSQKDKPEESKKTDSTVVTESNGNIEKRNCKRRRNESFSFTLLKKIPR